MTKRGYVRLMLALGASVATVVATVCVLSGLSVGTAIIAGVWAVAFINFGMAIENCVRLWLPDSQRR